jgi:hypothetical protein
MPMTNQRKGLVNRFVHSITGEMGIPDGIHPANCWRLDDEKFGCHGRIHRLSRFGRKKAMEIGSFVLTRLLHPC